MTEMSEDEHSIREEYLICDGCKVIKLTDELEPTEDGRGLLCSECIKIKDWEIDIFYPHPVGNGSPFRLVYTGSREHMCNLMEAIALKNFGASLVTEQKEGNTCHFCGTCVIDGYETGRDRHKRHWLSDCRPDLVEHEPGKLCTWHAQEDRGYDCYAYQNSDTREWTNEHKHFYPDGPMG
jgi:hypothetical protein